jgi:DNA-binding Lrp family transcriptional regulator
MIKRSKDAINEDKKLVLSELQKNANKSVNEIANKLGFSRQKVWKIIKDFESDKTIWGYTAIGDIEKQGLNHYILLIKRAQKPISKELIEKIQSDEIHSLFPSSEVNIRSSFYVHGIFDMIVSFTARDLKQAKKVQEAFLKNYKGFIQEIFILENIFTLRDHGILNPYANKLGKML